VPHFLSCHPCGLRGCSQYSGVPNTGVVIGTRAGDLDRSNVCPRRELSGHSLWTLYIREVSGHMIPRIFAALERGHCCVRRMVQSILILIGRPLEMEVGMEPLEPQFGEQYSARRIWNKEWSGYPGSCVGLGRCGLQMKQLSLTFSRGPNLPSLPRAKHAPPMLQVRNKRREK